jgi:hypothetical protein
MPDSSFQVTSPDKHLLTRLTPSVLNNSRLNASSVSINDEIKRFREQLHISLQPINKGY